MYASSFLQAVSAFETFQEELFFSCLLGLAGIVGARPLVKPRTRPEAERIASGGERRAFLSWSKMKDNWERADVFLSSGRPFSRLQRHAKDLQVLDIVTKIRNAIAHESGAARTKFRTIPMGSLPSRRRVPAGYLQSITGSLTQHEILLNELDRISRALAANSDRIAFALLREEDTYRSGSESVRGNFECLKCKAVVRNTALRPLDPCSTCNSGPCPHCGAARPSRFKRR
jgi:hypothetical protein